MEFLKKQDKILWTRHSKEKLRQYQLSEKRVLRVLRKPERREEGIAPGTIAAMQTVGTKKSPKEIWVMYEIENQRLKIISAWKYPGKSKIGKTPIPEDILNELKGQY
jgi:hypothetical protein